MTDEAQQLEIEKALGLISFPLNSRWANLCEREDGTPIEKPHFLHDLNSCHEMEKAGLTNQDQWQEYWHTLDGLCGYEQAAWVAGCATARQRCEAFLKTIGKWPHPQTA